MVTVESQPEPLIDHLGKDWSALGAQVKAVQLCDRKGWSLAAPLLDPHLRADCHRGRISFWRALLLKFFL